MVLWINAVACLISSWGLNLPHHITNAALSSEVGGIAKRIKTSRLRRKTKLQKSKFALDKIKKHQRAHHNVGTCLWHVPTLWRYRFGKFDGLFTKKIFYHQGFFAVKRRAVFILGAKWTALVRGWRRDCVVGGMETRFQWRKAHSRTAKCEAFHFAPRLFFMFLFLIPPTIPATMQNLSPGMFHWTTEMHQLVGVGK